MPGAQVAVAAYCPNWWPAATKLLIRRVRLDVAAAAESPDPRAGRRRTMHPDQRALPLPDLAELAAIDQVYGYSFKYTSGGAVLVEAGVVLPASAVRGPDVDRAASGDRAAGRADRTGAAVGV